MFKPGDVVFFKDVKKEPRKSSVGARFSGWGFGVLLGECPVFVPAPPASQIFRFMANAGFTSFDDVIEFVGEEKGKEFVRWFEMKYYGRTSEDVVKEGAAKPEEIEPLKILGVDGRPLNRLTSQRVTPVEA